MANEEDKVEKVPIGRINKGLVDKAKEYKELTGTSTVELVEDLLTDFFKDKVLTNDFIELEKSFYFDFKELVHKKIVKASSEVPISNLETCFVVNKVPNNLDIWNAEEETYCSGNPSIHKGIYIYYNILFNSEDYFKISKIFEKTLILKYDSSKNELEISLVNYNDLYLYVPSNSNSTILDRIEKEKDYFYKNIVHSSENNIIDPEMYIGYFNIMKPYKVMKKLLIFYESEEFKAFSERLDNAEETVVVNEDGEEERHLTIDNEDFKTMYFKIFLPILETDLVLDED